MASDAPAFTRCTLAVAHLGHIEVTRIEGDSDRTRLSVVVELTAGWNLWEAAEHLSRSELPSGVTLVPQVRLPNANRLTFEATVPAGAHSAAEATRLVAWIADHLVASRSR